ncbi:hypothetical protein BDV93DRAFT_519337 [Ceratobasidium sp. AG-I]|nr:hypothetical protein BDV93DRAFT_519337 [Ceratobasidium sp. AG-I]
MHGWAWNDSILQQNPGNRQACKRCSNFASDVVFLLPLAADSDTQFQWLAEKFMSTLQANANKFLGTHPEVYKHWVALGIEVDPPPEPIAPVTLMTPTAPIQPKALHSTKQKALTRRWAPQSSSTTSRAARAARSGYDPDVLLGISPSFSPHYSSPNLHSYTSDPFPLDFYDPPIVVPRSARNRRRGEDDSAARSCCSYSSSTIGTLIFWYIFSLLLGKIFGWQLDYARLLEGTFMVGSVLGAGLVKSFSWAYPLLRACVVNIVYWGFIFYCGCILIAILMGVLAVVVPVLIVAFTVVFILHICIQGTEG